MRLICRSQWGQHVPGCLRAAVLDDRAIGGRLARVAARAAGEPKNAQFYLVGHHLLPARGAAGQRGPGGRLREQAAAGPDAGHAGGARQGTARRPREARRPVGAGRGRAGPGAGRVAAPEPGRCWASPTGPGNDNCYKFIHDKIRAADPKDESGAVRWLGFGGDPRDGVPWTEPSWAKALEKKELTDADYEEALARIDKELKDPRNRVLDHERIQRIMIAKYHVYKRWPKHEEQRFDVQREIAAFDPDTFWGIGARGELGLHHRSATPMLTYGWAANQVKPGLNTWDMTDTAYFFDHAGPYKLRLTYTGGKDDAEGPADRLARRRRRSWRKPSRMPASARPTPGWKWTWISRTGAPTGT